MREGFNTSAWKISFESSFYCGVIGEILFLYVEAILKGKLKLFY